MHSSGKEITRADLYAALWQLPLSKLAISWGVSISSITTVAQRLNIPRPSSGHWELVRRGWEIVPEPLPQAEEGFSDVAVIKAKGKRTARAATPVNPNEGVRAQPKNSQDSEIFSFVNAHPVVRAMRKALSGDTYIHNGIIQTRESHDSPLFWLHVSPGQVDRALEIIDVVLKAGLKMGGRLVRGEGWQSWKHSLHIGGQLLVFNVREVMKRMELDLTDEERKARGLSTWDKFEWHGSGLLRFKVCGGQYVIERTWTETKSRPLSHSLPEIVENLWNIEKDAAELRSRDEALKRKQAEQNRREEILWRRREMESERRKKLEVASEEWCRAERLRAFVRARELGGAIDSGVPDTATVRWLSWARRHADRIDPLKNGYPKNRDWESENSDND